ncbi:MAG: LysE family translocator [Pseudomonadota bacterium]
MPAWDLMLAFFAATILFAVMPGPALLYTAAQTLARGRRAGLMAALGIHIGGLGHVMAAALGLSAVFKAAPVLYALVKFAGALYLIWLGFMMLRRQPGDTAETPHLAPKSAGRAFFESIVVELLNPKVAIFFVAFLPQFVSPEANLPLWAQFLFLGIIVNLAFSTADIITVFFTAAMVRRMRESQTGQRVARTLGGSAMIGLGVHLAASRQ